MKIKKEEKLGNAIIAVMTIIGGISATIIFAFIIYKWLI